DQRNVKFSNNSGQIPINPSHQYQIIAMIDGGYCFVMAGPSDDITPGFIDAQWVAKVVFIRPTYYTTQPSIIYQYMSQAISMNIETCDNTYYEPGLACVFSIKSSNTSNISSRYVKVAFFSSGGVKASSTLNITDTTFNLDKMYQLWSGGYLLVTRLKTNNTFIGYVYNLQGNFFKAWDSPTIPGNLVIPNGVFLNNTVWMISDVNSTVRNESIWNLTTTVAYKF
ncbi:16017_t:CDS:1, partial [Cetraspora pellucida]